jgi:4-aminobutyrate aminotransferase-like enzyme
MSLATSSTAASRATASGRSPRSRVQAIARATRDACGLLVADEVQAGHGRSGQHLWSFAQYGLAPDALTDLRIRDVRGRGFLLGVELESSQLAVRAGRLGQVDGIGRSSALTPTGSLTGG